MVTITIRLDLLFLGVHKKDNNNNLLDLTQLGRDSNRHPTAYTLKFYWYDLFYMKIFFPNGSFIKGRKYAVMYIHTLFSYRPYI